MLGNQQPITEQLTAHIQQLKDIHATLNTISQDIYLNTTETGCLELVGSLRRQLAEAAREILYLGTLHTSKTMTSTISLVECHNSWIAPITISKTPFRSMPAAD